MKCPKCQANWKQYKAGLNPSGSQRYRCGECNCVHTPEPKRQGYSIEEQWNVVHQKLAGHETVALPDLLNEYLMAVNADFLGKKTFHELETECQPMFILGETSESIRKRVQAAMDI